MNGETVSGDSEEEEGKEEASPAVLKIIEEGG